MATSEIEIIKKRIGALSESEKIELISVLNGSLRKTARASKPLQYGKYRNSGRKLSTNEDFKVAEWHPTDPELNGDPIRS